MTVMTYICRLRQLGMVCRQPDKIKRGNHKLAQSGSMCDTSGIDGSTGENLGITAGRHDSAPTGTVILCLNEYIHFRIWLIFIKEQRS